MVGPRSLRVVFFGTPQFAVPTLDRLLASRHVVAGVVTQPDRPRGRGQKTVDAPIKARASEAGLPILARSNHAFYISHYPLGRDATVSWGGPELVFRNDLRARYSFLLGHGASSASILWAWYPNDE